MEKPSEGGEEEKKDEQKEEEDKGEKPNAGNGGKTDKYFWEQTLAEVTVNVPIEAHIKGNMLKVDMSQKKLKVAIKNGKTLLDGEWCEPILLDDSLWCIESAEG